MAQGKVECIYSEFLFHFCFTSFNLCYKYLIHSLKGKIIIQKYSFSTEKEISHCTFPHLKLFHGFFVASRSFSGSFSMSWLLPTFLGQTSSFFCFCVCFISNRYKFMVCLMLLQHMYTCCDILIRISSQIFFIFVQFRHSKSFIPTLSTHTHRECIFIFYFQPTLKRMPKLGSFV